MNGLIKPESKNEAEPRAPLLHKIGVSKTRFLHILGISNNQILHIFRGAVKFYVISDSLLDDFIGFEGACLSAIYLTYVK